MNAFDAAHVVSATAAEGHAPLGDSFRAMNSLGRASARGRKPELPR
jgi:hypothetical protein